VTFVDAYPKASILRALVVPTAGGDTVWANTAAAYQDLTPELRALADSGAITWHARAYQPGDLAGARLVFAATDQRAVNAQVADDAAALELLCNVADDPRAGDFHLPAVYREPGLLVAVSTAGASPARAKQLRDQIASWLSTFFH